MRALAPIPHALMRVAVGTSGAANLVSAAFNVGALLAAPAALPAMPHGFLVLGVVNGVLVAGLSFVCVWMMGE